jgi:hypothetical protein
MQTWKLIGVGLLISVLVRGCPDAAKQSTSFAEKQSLQSPNTQIESALSSKIPSSLLKLPSISPVSPLLHKDIQNSSPSSVARNRPADSEKSQQTSSQISVIPSVGKEASSRVIQQEPETNFDVSRVQANVPVDGESRQSLIDRGSAQRAKVSVLEFPNVETELRPTLENALEPLSENSFNPALRSDTTTSTNEENIAPQDQRLSSPVVSSSFESGSGRCNYSWEFDSAGNRCGDRAASEQPNLSTGSAVGSYSAPIRSYSIPTSSYGSTYVRGYFRRDGTYVRGHSRRSR